MSNMIIKPKKGSKKFYKNAKQFQRIVDPTTNQPTGEYAAAGEYSSERFPNSKQGPRVHYSFSKDRWLLYKSNGTEFDSKELNELVKGCHFNYEKGVRKGDIIKKADITNLADPFFNHSQLRIRLKEGSATLSTDSGNAMATVMGAGLRANRRFKEAGKAGNAFGASNVKYIISDKEQDLHNSSKGRDTMIDANKKFDALNDRQRMIFARIMGLGVRGNTDRALVDDVLYKAATDPNTMVTDRNISQQDMFFKLCDMDKDELEYKDLLSRARSSNILRKTKEGWSFRGQAIGRTTATVESFFKDPEHQESLMAMEQALEDQNSVDK